MKRKGAIKFIVSTALILLLAYIMCFGVNVGDYIIDPIKKGLKLGLDLKGGVTIEEEIKEKNVSNETLERTKQLLSLRINSLGVTESNVTVSGANRIRIEIPGISDASKALAQVGKTGKLKFVGPDNSEIITGSDVQDATVGTNQETQEPVVLLKLKSSGASKFDAATKKYLQQAISIYMDDDLVASPTVEQEIPNGDAQISCKTVDEAKRIAGVIKSGALPVTLEAASVQTIGPSLGAEAIPTSKKAAIIGVAAVLIFMLFYYKIPGLIADLALTVYIMLSLFVFYAINATLTLPGIAGFLLTVGMAVDANVLIFERVKEELNNGKSLRTSIDTGFHRALSSIIDSNVTTLIAGFTLYFLGSGTVKGFALTLDIGVICSFFTAVTVTRFLLNAFVDTGWIKNTWFYRP